MSNGFEDLEIKLTDLIEKKEKDHRVYVREFYRNIIHGQGFSDWTKVAGKQKEFILKVMDSGKKEWWVQSCR